ncbi:MAG: 4'-phosphopantetheinyl transferase superfamily protein [Myxococcota bacterium]
MLGNDVVDLRDRDSHPATLHPRFDERVFTARERAALAASDSTRRERWRLWAAKEAAYKAARKLEPRICFSPRRFAVDGRTAERRVVVDSSFRFLVRLFEGGSSIHAVAIAEGAPPRELVYGMRRLPSGDPDLHHPQGPSRAVRRLSVERLARRLGVDAEELCVRRQGRIPKLWMGARPLEDSLSLSHHGALVAFACALVERDSSWRAAL